MDENLLAALDLSEGERRLYRAVMNAGQIAPADLAKAAGIKRTTAYSMARGLVEKGLIVEDAMRRPRVFSPASAEQVLSLIERDRTQIARREESFQKLAAELSQRSAQHAYPVPTVRFIEQGKIGEFLRQQSPVWDTSLADTDEVWWGFQDHTFVEEFGEWIDWYWTRISGEVAVQLLSNRAPIEVEFGQKHAERGKRQIKYWGEANNFLSTTWVIGDYVVMINTRTSPFYLVEIHDKLMAHDQREVFRNLWEMV